ncbi:uncharacterized protein A4U43_C05F25400 [Asparagus officinalis]|uniref:Uncharacterized protein n=1 Tax=Asparagus officinalis TaxID=4686 RepID=A0A5P1EYV3_ASPOF|nr:uncharacterized protein A4U43_C05F25400 [Asparagus officinalis]
MEKDEEEVDEGGRRRMERARKMQLVTAPMRIEVAELEEGQGVESVVLVGDREAVEGAGLEEGQGVESVVLVGDREAVEGAGSDNLIDDGEPLAAVEGCELVAEVRG